MLTYDTIASIAFASMNAFKVTLDETYKTTSWKKIPEWYRQFLAEKVEDMRNNPTQTTFQLHDAWVERMSENGWAYGDTYSEKEKTHPYLKPYLEFSDIDQTNFMLLNNVSRALQRIR